MSIRSYIPTINDTDPNAIIEYDQEITLQTHVTTWSGPWAAQSSNVDYCENAGVVFLNLGKIEVVPTIENESIDIDTVLPAAIRPSAGKFFPLKVRNNGTHMLGHLQVEVSGTIRIFKTIGSNTFTGLGPGFTGFSETTITYIK